MSIISWESIFSMSATIVPTNESSLPKVNASSNLDINCSFAFSVASVGFWFSIATSTSSDADKFLFKAPNLVATAFLAYSDENSLPELLKATLVSRSLYSLAFAMLLIPNSEPMIPPTNTSLNPSFVPYCSAKASFKYGLQIESTSEIDFCVLVGL